MKNSIKTNIDIFCDLDCKYASFPKKLCDGAATCRTFVALYCDKKKHVVYKNGFCRDKENP